VRNDCVAACCLIYYTDLTHKLKKVTIVVLHRKSGHVLQDSLNVWVKIVKPSCREGEFFEYESLFFAFYLKKQ